MGKRFQLANLLLFGVTVVHALLTWSLADMAVLFTGGIMIAFSFEAAATNLGLLEHNSYPQVASVPVTVVLVWPSIVYIFYRGSLMLIPDGIPAAALAAVVATTMDVILDPIAVQRKTWYFPESTISQPRYRGVPWWNFVGWLVIVFLTAMLPMIVA